VKTLSAASSLHVMPDLVPGFHVLNAADEKDVDGRDKPGHGEKGSS